MRVAPESVWVVLCHPADPRNVGPCIRAVANFGLAGVRLVGGEAMDADTLNAFASGSLAQVRLERFPDLGAALHDATFTLGTSRRHHEEDGPVRLPAAGLGDRLAGRTPACLVFGHERNGLSRAELDLCDAVVAIPTADRFPSMNLSHAVAVLAYELARPETNTWAPPRPAPANADQRSLNRDAVFREIAAACERLGYPPGRSALAFARRLRRLLTRAEATAGEMSLVAGLFRELERLKSLGDRDR